MHQCMNVKNCNFAVFGLIFMKFSPNCRAKELGMLFTIFGSFCSFLDWEGPRKIPDSSTNIRFYLLCDTKITLA